MGDAKPVLDWFEMIRIGSDTGVGMNRNSFDSLGINLNPKLSPALLCEFLGKKSIRLGARGKLYLIHADAIESNPSPIINSSSCPSRYLEIVILSSVNAPLRTSYDSRRFRDSKDEHNKSEYGIIEVPGWEASC